MSEYIRTNKFDTNECPNIFVKEKLIRTNVRKYIRDQYIRIFEYSNIFVTLWCISYHHYNLVTLITIMMILILILIIVTEVVGAWMPLVSWSHSWPRLKNFSFWSFQPRSSAYSFIIKGRRNKTFFETRWDTFTWNLLILSEEEKTCWALFDPFFFCCPEQPNRLPEVHFLTIFLHVVYGCWWLYCIELYHFSTKRNWTCKSWFHNIFTN